VVVRLAEEYLSALEGRDLARLLALFAEGAVVHSPLYGTLPAVDFYPRLFLDTRDARLTLRAVLHGAGAGVPARGSVGVTADEGGVPGVPGAVPGPELVAFWFDFDWTLADGTPAPFEAVDLAELDAEGRIRALHIVYDTFRVRPAFNALA
jgi:hypothetical protein